MVNLSENMFLLFGEKRGAESFYWKKKGMLIHFSLFQNPQNLAWVPHEFWLVPYTKQKNCMNYEVCNNCTPNRI